MHDIAEIIINLQRQTHFSVAAFVFFFLIKSQWKAAAEKFKLW